MPFCRQMPNNPSTLPSPCNLAPTKVVRTCCQFRPPVACPHLVIQQPRRIRRPARVWRKRRHRPRRSAGRDWESPMRVVRVPRLPRRPRHQFVNQFCVRFKNARVDYGPGLQSVPAATTEERRSWRHQDRTSTPARQPRAIVFSPSRLGGLAGIAPAGG